MWSTERVSSPEDILIFGGHPTPGSDSRTCAASVLRWGGDQNTMDMMEGVRGLGKSADGHLVILIPFQPGGVICEG